MRSQTALISVIAGCLSAAIVSGQVSHHNPVIHHGSAKSFQSFTYFGHKSYPATQAFSESAQVKSTLKYTPLTTKAPYVAPTYRSLATPARYNPVAARATSAPKRPAPVPQPTAAAPAPYKPAKVTQSSVAIPAPVTHNNSPAPALYKPSPAPVSYSTAATPAPYKPVSVTYNRVAAPAPVSYNKSPALAPAPYYPSPAPISHSTAAAPAPYHLAQPTPQRVAFTSQPASVKPLRASPTFKSFVHSNSPSLTASPSLVSVAVPAVPSTSQQNIVRNIVRKPIESYYRNFQSQATRNALAQASTRVAPLITTSTFKPIIISTTAFVPTGLRTDISASEIVDAALEDIKKEGPKLVKVVAKIQTNRLIKRLFSTDDSCNVFPENIAEVLERLNEAAISSRSDLINIIAASQEMKKNENNTQVVLLEASNALLAINPLLPIFREIFPTNEGCDSNIKASVVGFNQIGSLLEVLGTTNLVSDNDVTKFKITKGGQTTKILADLVKKLEEGGFTTLCEGSSTFSSDVLLGVSELLKAFEKIAVAFDAKSELSDLGKTVAVIRDGAVSISF